jgi:hypothetical protein
MILITVTSQMIIRIATILTIIKCFSYRRSLSPVEYMDARVSPAYDGGRFAIVGLHSPPVSSSSPSAAILIKREEEDNEVEEIHHNSKLANAASMSEKLVIDENSESRLSCGMEQDDARRTSPSSSSPLAAAAETAEDLKAPMMPMQSKVSAIIEEVAAANGKSAAAVDESHEFEVKHPVT